jgi:hypothetical protein
MAASFRKVELIFLLSLLGYLLFCVYCFSFGSIPHFQSRYPLPIYYFFKISFNIGFVLCYPALVDFEFLRKITSNTFTIVLALTGSTVAIIFVFSLHLICKKICTLLKVPDWDGPH